MIKRITLLVGPLAFLLVYNLPYTILSPEADKVLAIAIWMIIWWCTESVSISVTALIPLTFFPLLDIMDIKSTAAYYGSPIVFLFFGGFVLALAMEKVNLHRRIALNIIKATGTSPDRVILGFMIATAFLSMWISNTATTVVMLPIALSVIDLLIHDEDGFTAGDRNFSLCIMLGIAFAANVGGIATVIGTPPNMVMIGFVESEYGLEVSFFNWMAMALPFTLIMLGVIYVVLVKFMYPNRIQQFQTSATLIDDEIKKLGKLQGVERNVLLVFCFAIFLWVFKNPVNKLLPMVQLSDTTTSMLAAFALFTIKFKEGITLDWKDTQKLPWGILILFGGGLALANGLSGAGVIESIGEAVSANKHWNILMVAALMIAVVLFMTELISNVALVAIFAPVVAGVAIGLGLPVMHLLIPIAMASSCAFMLPMATPPNAIVFASGHIEVAQMAKAGIFLNIISIMLLVVFYSFVIPLFF